MAESVEGDLSGYIQTNLMSITDGHLFFDNSLYNQGKRPAINPFLSVTRVGRQTQSEALKEMGRNVATFLTELRRLRDLMHFGAELNESVKARLALGDRLEVFFYRFQGRIIMLPLSMFIVGALWIGAKELGVLDLEKKIEKILNKYESDKGFEEMIAKVVGGNNLEGTMRSIRQNLNLLEI
jgi:F-type H+-transporting ATPase subunit alpha